MRVTFLYHFLIFQGDEPRFTNHEGSGCLWTLDYIWFDSANLKVTAALETVSKEAIEPYEGLPNQFFSSDHLPLKAHFKFAASQWTLMAVYCALNEKELVGIYWATWFIKARLAEVIKELRGVRVLSVFFWRWAGGGGEERWEPTDKIEVWVRSGLNGDKLHRQKYL